MRYMITGGYGFIGAHLARKLLALGHDVIIFDNLTRGRRGRLDDVIDQVCEIRGDIRDEAAVVSASKGVDGIFHLAAINGTENFYNHPELVLDVGLRGMLSVMSACKQNDIADVIVASSAEVYQLPPIVPTPETAPLVVPDPMNPRFCYGGSKIASELIALNYGIHHDGRVIIFRPHNVYGADMGWKHVIPQFIMRALEGMGRHPSGPLPFEIQGDGSETRAFCHVDDICRGLIKLLEAGEHRTIYHIGTSDEIAIRDVAAMVVGLLGRDIALTSMGDVQPGSTPRRCPDITRMRELGYEPRFSLDDALPGVIDWYKANWRLQPREQVLL